MGDIGQRVLNMAKERRSKVETMVAGLVKFLGCTPRDAIQLLWANARHEAAEQQVRSYYRKVFTTKEDK